MTTTTPRHTARELLKSYIQHRTSYIGRPRLPPPCQFALRAKAAPLSIRTYRPLRVRPQRSRRACCTSYIENRTSYIGASVAFPSLRPSLHNFATVFASPHPRASSGTPQIVHRKSYIVHRRRQAPPPPHAFPVRAKSRPPPNIQRGADGG